MRWSAVLAVPLLAATLAVAPAHARTWSQDWTVGAHPTIHVRTDDGHVRVHRGGAGRVTAQVEYLVKVWGLHSTLHGPTVEMTRQGDSIDVVANVGSRTTVVFFGGVSETFHIDVTVPPDCDLRVRSGDGAVESDALNGSVDLETGDGRVTLKGGRGRIRLWTGDGGIDAEGLDGVVTAHTGDGGMDLSGRFDRVDARTGDGHMTVDARPGSRLADEWRIESGDGRVTLRIPRDLKALLDVATRDGRVRVDLPIAGKDSFSEHAVRGTLNGGTVPLRVRTGDGGVTLELSE